MPFKPADAVRTAFTIQRVDDLAIRAGLECIVRGQPLLEFAMVVDLAVDREHEFAIGGSDRLGATGRIDDGKALVDEDGAVIGVHAAPVGAAMALPLRQLERKPAQRSLVVACLQAEDAEYRTHEADSLLENRMPGKQKARSVAGLQRVYGMKVSVHASPECWPRIIIRAAESGSNEGGQAGVRGGHGWH